MDQMDKWEERGSEYLSFRNEMVREGRDPNSKNVNVMEERAANALSKAKSIRQARRG